MARPTLVQQFEKRVEAGAAYLNVVKPGWEMKVKPERLNLAAGFHCVIGQLYGEYDPGVSELLCGLEDRKMYNAIAQNLGLYAPNHKHYPKLTEAWLKKIKSLRRRREAAKKK